MIIQENLDAIWANNSVKKIDRQKCKTLEKLSSGLRINKAADDSAGLSISEKMKAQINGLRQAQRNVQDGISLVQIASQGLGEIINPNLIRMRELTIQAGDGALTIEDRQMIQREMEQLKRGVDEIAQGANFNGIKLLSPQQINKSSGSGSGSGGQTDIVFLIDGTSSMSTAVATLTSNIPALVNNLASYGVNNIRFGVSVYYDNMIHQHFFSGSSWTSSITDLTADLTSFSPPAVLDSETVMNGVVNITNNYTFNSTGHIIIVSDSGDDIINDNTTESAALAAVTAKGITVHGAFNFSSHGSEDEAPIRQLVSDSNGSMVDYSQAGWGSNLSVNIGGAIASSVSSGSADYEQIVQKDVILHVGANEDQNLKVHLVDARSKMLGIEDLKIDSFTLVDEALQKIDKAIKQVSVWQSQFGSHQNALDAIANNLLSMDNNTTSAQSKICDADISYELMQFAKEQVLAQTSEAMLLKAKIQPQRVLDLLDNLRK